MGNDKAPTLTEFLLARIAEDEAVARACDVPHWRPGDGDVSEGGLYGLEGDGSDDQKGWAIAWFELGETNPPRADGRPGISGANWQRHAHENSVHTARHDPARVLAECEAKRAVIKAAWSDHCLIEGEWGGGQSQGAMSAKNDNPAVVEALASVYADHPDFQEAWRP